MGPETVWLQNIFFEISSYVFHRGKYVIQVLNNMRVSIYFLNFWVEFLNQVSLIVMICHYIFVTLDHKTSHKSHWCICCNSQHIAWVKIINFSFMPKIIRILSKDYVP